MKNKITIIGRGMNPAKHLSVAAIRALRQADKIVGLEPEKETWGQLRVEFNIPEIEDVSSLYKNGAKDRDNYNAFINNISELSIKYKNLVLLVAGHPCVGVSFIQQLEKKITHQTEIEITEGISSFDVMINDLKLDPLERGTAILDANRMILFQYQLEPALDYFIYHVCSVGNPKTNYKNAAEGNHPEILKNYLLKTYEAGKKMFLCKASSGKEEKTEIIPFALSDLDQMSGKIDFRTSLHVPAEKPSRIDRLFLEMLR